MRSAQAVAIAKATANGAKPSITARVSTGIAPMAARNNSQLVLVGDTVLTAAKRMELSDVGSRNEGLAAGAAEHRGAQTGFLLHSRTSVTELSVDIRHVMALRAHWSVNDHGSNRPSRA